PIEGARNHATHARPGVPVRDRPRRHARPRHRGTGRARSDDRADRRPGRRCPLVRLDRRELRCHQFLAAPLLGRAADRYGRRPVLILALSFLGLDYLAHAVANRPVTMLAAHALAGALAGTMTVVNA